MGHLRPCLFSTAHWTHSSLLRTMRTAALHPTRSWATQFATLIEYSILDALHWSLKRTLGRLTLRVPSDSSPYSICLGNLELPVRAETPRPQDGV